MVVGRGRERYIHTERLGGGVGSGGRGVGRRRERK